MPETRTKHPPASLDLPSLSRILLVTDFSALSIAAVPFARLLAEYYGASLVLVHVLAAEPQADGSTQQPGQTGNARQAAEAQLQEFVARNSLGETNCETVVGEGPVWEVLAALVEEKKIDLIVVGTHGRSGVGKLLMGSVAQRVFTFAPCPVVTVSPRARQTWGADQRLTRILFPTDFSPASLHALPYALSLAKVSRAELLLLHAPESSVSSSSEIVLGYQQHLSALIPLEYRSWCRSDALVMPGEPARAILHAAERNSVDFIVLGAYAIEGSLATLQVPLSTAYRVVAHAHCPVLRVRSYSSSTEAESEKVSS